MLEQQELVRLYGPWRGHTPPHALELLHGYPGRWWVAGGWAIEAFTGRQRPHGDLDLGLPRSDVGLLQEHLSGRLDVWAADQGSLRPLRERDEPLSGTCGNLWLRASGAEPWEYDVLLTPVEQGVWTYKRDARVTLPVEHTLWSSGGVAYLLPEVQLLHKAKAVRAKDQEDFEACLPLLSSAARRWLRTALDVAHPTHAWRGRLT